jgi:F-type H+-transporting ATPase subunit epsilon
VTLQVELVSPEQILFSGDSQMVICRTTDGEIAFLTGHAPFVGALGIGTVTIRLPDGSDEKAAVHGGFVEVSHDRVTILSDVAEMALQIDILRAQEAKEVAERLLHEQQDSAAEAALRRAHVRIELAQDRQTRNG